MSDVLDLIDQLSPDTSLTQADRDAIASGGLTQADRNAIASGGLTQAERDVIAGTASSMTLFPANSLTGPTPITLTLPNVGSSKFNIGTALLLGGAVLALILATQD
jgi:hypothetical protein